MCITDGQSRALAFLLRKGGLTPWRRGGREEDGMTDDQGSSYRSVWRYLMQVPFKQDYIMAGGLRTRYVQAGPRDAPALLMLHGTGGHWETFCANLGPLSQRFNCIVCIQRDCTP